MGRDKSLLEVDGRALAATVADALASAGADEVVAVGGDADSLGGLGLTVVPDLHPGQGPLGGILTAIDHLGAVHRVVAILACDLPAAHPANVSAVVRAVRDVDGPAVGVPVVGGRRQWLHASWTVAAGPLLATQFEAGERAPWRAVEAAAGRGLCVVEVEGPSERGFRDVDRPADLEAFDR